MSNENSKLDAGLLPCPHCGGPVSFHQDEECDGCHWIECKRCRAFFDYATGADPENASHGLEDLQRRCAGAWNRRASLPVGVPDGLLTRIDAAIKSFTSGRASMHVPPEPDDVDMVLGECWKLVNALIAAPTVKAEQVDRESFRAHLSECAAEVEKWPSWKRNCLGSAAEDCPPKLSSEVECMVRALEDGEWAEHVGHTELGARLESTITKLINRLQAPSLPAAGSAVESWCDQLQREFPNSEPEHWPDSLTIPAMGREIRELRAALSAQQSAPERVGVTLRSSMELIKIYRDQLVEDIGELDDIVMADQVLDELRALLASHGRPTAATEEGEV